MAGPPEQIRSAERARLRSEWILSEREGRLSRRDGRALLGRRAEVHLENNRSLVAWRRTAGRRLITAAERGFSTGSSAAIAEAGAVVRRLLPFHRGPPEGRFLGRPPFRRTVSL